MESESRGSGKKAWGLGGVEEGEAMNVLYERRRTFKKEYLRLHAL